MKKKKLKEIKYSDQEIDQKFTESYNKLFQETIEHSYYNTETASASATAFDIPEQRAFSSGSGVVTVTRIPSETYTRASENLLRQTIGKKRDPYQPSLFDTLLEQNQELKDNVTKSNIEDIGASLSVSARYALHAIQTLFTHTDYKGNDLGGKLRITIPEYLDAYGVTKKDLGRGKLEYNPKERKDALSALEELNKPILWYYQRVNQEKTKKAKGARRYDIIKGVDPIIRVKEGYQGLTEEEAEKVKRGEKVDTKLTHLEVTPSEIFLDKHFVLIPEPTFRLIREKYKKPSTHFLTFVTMLFLEANHKRYTVTRYYQTLTDNLHLFYLEKTRQRKRLETALEEDFKRAQEIGLVKSYSIETDVKGKKVILELNASAFYQDKKLKEAKQIEAQ